MRFTFVFIALLFSFSSFSQTSPVRWQLRSVKNAEGQYLLQLTGTINAGWAIYAVDDTELGLQNIVLSWEQADIRAVSSKRLSDPVDYADPIFGKKLKVYREQVAWQQEIKCGDLVPAVLKVKVTGFAVKGNEFKPLEETVEVTMEGGVVTQSDKKLQINLASPVADCGEKVATVGDSLWGIFGKGFIGGLIALLMPCIFPMLPVTVSFFMNRASSRSQGIRNGFFYGIFILLIYVIASLPFHLAGSVNPQLFNSIATDKWVNLAFFLIFLLFALSLFGLFELRLPGANSAGTRGNAGSILGIFFMALTLAIVSFSCTGPILGFLLVNSIDGPNGAWALTAGMAGFGVALALPFSLFAIFPQWLKKLPRSGGWMETLKKSLAFVELALALKFLSNADLVEHWGILKRETFIAIWIIITVALAVYLLNVKGRIRFGRWNTSRGRVGFGLLVLLFAAYLVPGLFPAGGGNLNLVSGFPPPVSYSIYGKSNGHGGGVEPSVVNDYEKALALAKKENKPLLIDFTGWACVNCRKMEENVWTEPDVKKVLEENFVIVSLYVDDRGKLATGGTVGEKWARFQSQNFNSASQPQYVILSPDEVLLNHPVGYTPAGEYGDWLKCGLQAFSDRSKLASAVPAMLGVNSNNNGADR